MGGCFEVTSNQFFDPRGSFEKIVSHDFFPEFCQTPKFLQVNISRNDVAGTLRGLHVQTRPYLESKVISCLTGSAFDVLLDLRRESPTFGKTTSLVLNPLSNLVIVAPGVAHGFQTLKDDTSLLYLHSEDYKPDLASGVRYDDATLDIAWPLEVTSISDNDLGLPDLSNYRGDT